ncbi:MAG: ATP-binding protein [Bacteroidota bacterium]
MQKKFYLLIAILCSALVIHAQDTSEDNESMSIKMTDNISYAQFDAERGDYFNAKLKLDEALEIAIQLQDKKNEGIIYSEIGRLQYTLKKYDKALASLTKAAQIQRDLDDDGNLALTYSYKGKLHYGLEEYQEALDYFNSAKTLFSENKLDALASGVTLLEAQIYYEQKKLDEAESHIDETMRLADRHNQSSILSSAHINKGKILLKKGEIDKALSNVEKGLEIAEENDLKENLSEAYLSLSEISKANEDFRLAHEYLQKHMSISDSLLDVKRANLSSEQRAEYLQAYNQADYQELKKKLEKQESESSLAKITTILSIALISILSLLTLALYKNNNIRLKSNNMLHEKNDDLIEAMKRAEQASKTKANFLSTVTHELRTPLYAVTGLTKMLLEEEPSEKQIPHLKSLKFSGEYLLQFINDILQINKIEANKVELDPVLFNLKTKVESVCSALTNSAINNGTKISFDYQRGLEQTFIGDNLKISQILINLIGNSIKFTKDGNIWVRVYSISQNGDDHVIRFEIEDNGIGISKEKQENMFESFSQGSIQINRKYGGTGLGLSIVKGLIEILKGKIYLKSELGKGTTFFFEIPLQYAPETAKIQTEDYSENIKALDISNIKILIVEDNKINQMITKKILTKMNLKCDIVDNGEDAVEKVKNSEYDVVLMDIHMPGISGLEATKRIRQFDRELTIFALTAVTLEDKMPEFDEAGFDDIISKPFKQEDFEKKLFEELSSNKKTFEPAAQ